MKINQINSLRSWRTVSHDVEIFLFGNGEGFPEVASELGIIHVPEVEVGVEGTPLYNSLFAYAKAHSRCPVHAFLACDNIVLDGLLSAVQRVQMDRYMIVGQRWDLDLNRAIDFEAADWSQILAQETRKRGQLHPPLGSDYFISRGDVWQHLPPIVVGRACDDNAIIYCCRAAGIPVIDGSEAIAIVHQNHGYDHHPQGVKGVWLGAEAEANRKFAGALSFYMTPVDADWRLLPKGPVRNYRRGGWESLFETANVLRPGTYIGKLSGVLLRSIRLTRRVQARITKLWTAARKR